MKNPNKPTIRLFLTKEIFNTLISSLSYFVLTKKEIGETFFSKYAEKIKTKILKHGRIFKNENGENISVYFYENESAILMKLLIYYISLGENSSIDFFEEFKKHKKKFEKYR